MFVVMLGYLLVVELLALSDAQNTVLSCSFPDAALAFSVYQFNLTSSDTTMLSPENDALNYNGIMDAVHGLTYTTDAGGSVEVRTLQTNLTISAPPSLNDHARWSPDSSLLVFTSTRDPNPLPNTGWAATFVAQWENGTLGEAHRLTPPNISDYSPAWDPTGSWVAVASGVGQANGTDIVVINATSGARRLVASHGGWPTWRDDRTILFHRSGSADLHSWGIFSVDIWTLEVALVMENGLTPFVSPGDPATMVFAFVDASSFRQIGMIDLTSHSTTTITSDLAHHYNPSFDPLSRTVVFHRCRGGTMPNLRRRTVDPSLAIDLAYTAGDFPSISPDGTQISVIDANFYIFYAISVFDMDGSNRRTIYNKTHAWMTSWVNDSIAFTSGPAFAPSNDGQVQVSTLNTTTGVVTQITDSDSFNQGYPCFSPDGSRIVYRTSDDFDIPMMPGAYHLSITNAHGLSKVVTTLTIADSSATIGDTHPHWGPHGIITFASDRGHPGRLTIWSIHEDGTNLTEIFDHGATSVHPTTTAHDNRIVFSSTIAMYSMEEISWPFVFFPTSELFVMNVDGSNLTRLTHDASTNANAFAGPQRLATSLSTDGRVTKCNFLDSTNPEETGLAATPADHAVVRRHGVGGATMGAEEIPSEQKRSSRCPFSLLRGK